MLGQGHKIILTMSRSRWPNCPNMCGANEVPSMRCRGEKPNMRCRGAKYVVPNLWCQYVWCQMCGAMRCRGARIPLKLEVTEVKRSRSRSNDGRHLGFVALNSHIWLA